ncbi:MAG TPA: hypothetical protein VFX29_01860 [Longimicrobiaceae bacterium]|nr:hypothetical protein [Longimicrobiaceae bacterium]
MTARVVELLGGPRDGELHQLAELPRELVFALYEAPSYAAQPALEASPRTRAGIDRYAGSLTYRWAGERAW